MGWAEVGWAEVAEAESGSLSQTSHRCSGRNTAGHRLDATDEYGLVTGQATGQASGRASSRASSLVTDQVTIQERVRDSRDLWAKTGTTDVLQSTLQNDCHKRMAVEEVAEKVEKDLAKAGWGSGAAGWAAAGWVA